MIIIILLVIFVFISWLFIPHKLTRYILGMLSSLLLILVIIGIVANMTHHFGMEKQTISNTKKIYTAGSSKSPANMLIANEIGKNSNNYILAYKDNKNDKKATIHNKPNTSKDHLSDTINTYATYETSTVNHATVSTTKKYWVWKSNFYKILFSFGKDKEFIQSHTTVSVPKDTWIVLNSEQAKQLKEKMAKQNNNAASQDTMKNIMKNKAHQYQSSHPDASKKEINNYLEREKSKLAVSQLKHQL